MLAVIKTPVNCVVASTKMKQTIIICADQYNDRVYRRSDVKSKPWKMRKMLVVKHIPNDKAVYSDNGTVEPGKFTFCMRKNKTMNLDLGSGVMSRFSDMFTDEECKTKLDCHGTMKYLLTGSKDINPRVFQCGILEQVQDSTVLVPGDTVAVGLFVDKKSIERARTDKTFAKTWLAAFGNTPIDKIVINEKVPALLHSAMYVGTDTAGEPLYLSKFGHTGPIGVTDMNGFRSYLCYPEVLMFKTKLVKNK